jgi:hypothetical protein
VLKEKLVWLWDESLYKNYREKQNAE